MLAPLRALALTALAVGAVGCGSSSGSPASTAPNSPSAPSAAQRAAVKATAKAARVAEDRAPKGASPVLRAIYRQFPAPQPAAREKSTAKAIEAGEGACRGKTPAEVKAEFFSAARANLEPEQAKLIAKISSYEKSATRDTSFVAGQLGADTYAATLAAADSQAGYRGCVYALAQGLEQRLAPGGR